MIILRYLLSAYFPASTLHRSPSTLQSFLGHLSHLLCPLFWLLVSSTCLGQSYGPFGNNVDAGQHPVLVEGPRAGLLFGANSDVYTPIKPPVIETATMTIISGTAAAHDSVQLFISGDMLSVPSGTFLGGTKANADGHWVLAFPFAAALQVGASVTAKVVGSPINIADFLAGALVQASACDVAHDSMELVHFFDTHNGLFWQNTNWKMPNTLLEDWIGVSTDLTGCVTYLALADTMITGPLPDFDLPHLIELSIIDSKLTGAVPDFSQMPLLEKLNLSNDRLDTFPNFLHLANLILFDADTNYFKGPIPPFNNLQKLEYLDLNYNTIKGAVPNFNLPKLTHLDLNTNKLEGNIPAFNLLPQLQWLGLAENCLTGPIPDFHNPWLNTIFLNFNKLSGPVPPLDDLTIVTFGFDYNRLTFAGMAYQIDQPYTDIAYAPQDSVFHDTIIYRFVGDTLDFPLDFDANVLDNDYSWTQAGNNRPQQHQTGVNRLIIPNLSTLHNGAWRVKVVNLHVPFLELHSRTIWLNVQAACPVITNNGPFCIGEHISIGVSNFQEFNWDSGPNGNTDPNEVMSATLADAGTYTYSATCFPNGTVTGSVNIQVVASPTVTSSVSGMSCQASTIQLSATGSGGVSWSWSGPNGFVSTIQNPVLTNLTPAMTGNYTVTVTSMSPTACTATSTVNVIVSAPSLVSNIMDAACGQNNGSITLNVTAGTSPFNYDWADLPGTNDPKDRTGLSPNTYTVTVTDASGCNSSTSAVVGQSGNPPTLTPNVVDAACGQNNGSITLNVTAGTSPFNYDWADLPGTNDPKDRTGLSPNTYTVTVTDASGCNSSTSAVVGQSGNPPTLTPNVVDAACGQNNGSITLNVTAGTSPFNYDWADLPGTNDPKDRTGLSPNTYTVTVTDASGCNSSTSAVVGQSGNPPTLTPNVVDAACGQNNGSITLNVTAGTSPFNYDWADLPGTNDPKDRTGLSPNTYTVTVTDASGCNSSTSAVVGQSGNPPTLTPNVVDAACGQNNGSITLNVTAGTSPFNYDWADLPGTNDPKDRTGLSPGLYSVTVTNALGCTSSTSATVGQSGNPLVETNQEVVRCDGENYSVAGLIFTDNVDTLIQLPGLQGCDTLLHLMLQFIKSMDLNAYPDTFRLPQGLGSTNLDILGNDDFLGLPLEFHIASPSFSGSFNLDYTVHYTLDPNLLGQDSFTYQVCLIQCPNLCSSTQVIIDIVANSLDLPDLSSEMPNTFTPGQDGYNDDFDPLREYNSRGFFPDLDHVRLQIVNRWGEEVWDECPYKAWPGRVEWFREDQILPAGQYYYILRLPEQSTKTKFIKGPITLIR